MAANPGGTPIRVLLVDDHAVVRAGYRRLLELGEGFAVVGEHGDADDALAAFVRNQGQGVDVIVLDLSMPGRGGLDLLRRLGARWPAVPVLVFSMHDRPATVAQALRAGAAGYVTKSSPPEELLRAVYQVAQGRRGVLSMDLAAAPGAPQDDPRNLLSAREFEVLQGLAEGLTLDAIAQRLSISAKTVANYQTLVRQKLGLTTAVELLRYARDHGLAD